MSQRSPITTHVLDTARGRPAAGIAVTLSRETDSGWTVVAEGTTDDDGRVSDLLAPGALEAGTFRIAFDVASYLPESFYPEVSITFRVGAPDEHYHVPLLLSPYGYSTYRGS